jgi:site-specific DNA-methyltransferase (adenine-specific)
MSVVIWHGENLDVLGRLDPGFSLIYIDPPFNTGKRQQRGSLSYEDTQTDYLTFLGARLSAAYRLLSADGSLLLHLDYREVHYAKVLCDTIFGRHNFVNEIIWAYDYGGRSKTRWSPKHDNILWYARDANNYVFNYDEIDRIPYLAPTLVGEEKAARGKTPTDVHWHTIVPTNGKEKTGYPTQKPLGLLSRWVRVHSNPGDKCLDFFAGSGSFGESCAALGRDVVLVDQNPDAVSIMAERLRRFAPEIRS